VFLPGGASVEATCELSLDPSPFTWSKSDQPGLEDVESDPQLFRCLVVYAALTPEHCVDEIRESDQASCGDLFDGPFFAGCEVGVLGDRSSFEVAHLVGEDRAPFALSSFVVQFDSSVGDAAEETEGS